MNIEKSIKKGLIVSAYNCLSNASFEKLTALERISCVKILNVLKRTAIEHYEYREELFKRLQPDNFSEIEKTRKLLKGMSDEERAEKLKDADIRKQITDYEEYISAIELALREFENTDTAIVYEPLSEDIFLKLIESNPSWNASATELIYDIVVGII